MAKHKNIYRTPNDTFAVRIVRKIGDEYATVTEIYSTLEEAIAARDAILRNFESTKDLQNSNDKRARRLARAIKRFETEDIVEIKANEISDRTLFVKRAECEICGTDISRSHYFMKSTKCIKCNLGKGSEHQRLILQKRIDRVEANKNNSIGIKNISYDQNTHRYCIGIERNGKRFRTSASTLEKAIQIKEKVLKFYKDHSRLPSFNEISNL